MLTEKLGADIYPQRHGNAMRNETVYTTERFTGDDGRRNRLLVLGPVDKPAQRDVGVVVKHATGAAGTEHGDGMLVGKEVSDLLQECGFFEQFLPQCRVARQHVAVVLVAIERIRTEVFESSLVVVFQRVRGVGIDLWRVAVKDDLSCQLALPGIEVFLLFQRRDGDDIAGSFARCGG